LDFFKHFVTKKWTFLAHLDPFIEKKWQKMDVLPLLWIWVDATATAPSPPAHETGYKKL